jgi:hypothetical protein
LLDDSKIDFEKIHKQEPVILSDFSTADHIVIKAAYTVPAFNNSEHDTIDVPNIKNAIIKNLSTGEKKEFYKDSDNNSLYVSKISIKEGDSYQVNFNFEKRQTQVSASDTVPFTSYIESLKVIPESQNIDNNSLFHVILNITPSLNAELANYYAVNILTQITDTIDETGAPIDSVMLIPQKADLYSDNPLIKKEPYYPSVLQFNAKQPVTLFFNKFHDNKKFIFDFYYLAPGVTVSDLEGNEYTELFNHTACIFLKTISYNNYKYNTSRLIQFYAREGDPLYGAGLPVNVYSNINGGTGIFSSFVTDSVIYNFQK